MYPQNTQQRALEGEVCFSTFHPSHNYNPPFIVYIFAYHILLLPAPLCSCLGVKYSVAESNNITVAALFECLFDFVFISSFI